MDESKVLLRSVRSGIHFNPTDDKSSIGMGCSKRGGDVFANANEEEGDTLGNKWDNNFVTLDRFRLLDILFLLIIITKIFDFFIKSKKKTFFVSRNDHKERKTKNTMFN
jgi:hypothetical protein